MNFLSAAKIKRYRFSKRRARILFGVGRKLKCITTSPNRTKGKGSLLIREIFKINPQKSAIVLALDGDLGGGKTTFLQGLARGLGIKEKILSPTFIIMKKFKIPTRQASARFKNFYHIDCYRISKPKDIFNLGFKKIASNPQNIIAVEWANRVRKILPKEIFILKFKFIAKNKREIIIQRNG